MGIPLTALGIFLALTIRKFTVLSEFWPEALLTATVVLWLSHFRLEFSNYQATLFHALTLTLGLIAGIPVALLSLTVGVIVYALFDSYHQQKTLKQEGLK